MLPGHEHVFGDKVGLSRPSHPDDLMLFHRNLLPLQGTGDHFQDQTHKRESLPLTVREMS